MIEYTFKTRLPLPQTVEELRERIRRLVEVKDALDKELGILMGHKAEFMPGTPWHCLRCGHKWLSRLPHQPRQCAWCKSYKFDTPPKYTYEERIARKKSLRNRMLAEQHKAEIADKSVDVAPLPHSVITRQVPQVTDDIQSITLAPPPVPSVPLSLRERLSLMNKRESVAGADASASNATVGGESPFSLQRAVSRPATLEDKTAHSMDETYQGAADTYPVSKGHDAAPLSEDDLIEAINGEPDAT